MQEVMDITKAALEAASYVVQTGTEPNTLTAYKTVAKPAIAPVVTIHFSVPA